MRSLPVKILAATVGSVLAVGLWLSFAPTKVGGSMTYSVTSGISMEPLLHKGDLAFVRAQSSYHVGDLTLYQSSVLHRPVLHRIILIQHGNYFFQGDNNDFVDPGYAKRDELVGTMWFSIPRAGSILGWFGEPAHAGLIAGLAVMAIVLASITTVKSRRRRRRRGPHTMKPSNPSKPSKPSKPSQPVSLPPNAGDRRPDDREARADDCRSDDREARADDRRSDDREARADDRRSDDRRPQDSRARAGESGPPTKSRRPPPYFSGPRSSLIALGVVATLAVLMLGVGYSRPADRIGTMSNAYRQTGAFSYSGTANAPTSVYPTGRVGTGDPIYPSLIDTVTLRFAYRLVSALPHQTTGTIEMRALILSESDTWKEASTVIPATKFTGDKTSISVDLPLASLYDLIDAVTLESGATGANYSVDIQPVVHVTGTVGDQPIDQKFTPVLPFAVSRVSIRVDAAAAPPPPGATYEAAAAGTALAAALHPTAAGSIPHLGANDITIAKYQVPIPALRVLGIVFAVFALALALIHDRARRKGVKWSDEELTAKRLHALIVPVQALGSPEGQKSVAVPDFANLAGLARFLERPILYQVSKGSRIYAVDDESLRYYTVATNRRQPRPAPAAKSGSEQSPEEPPPADPGGDPPSGGRGRFHKRQVSSASAPAGRSRGAWVARGVAGLFLLSVITTLTLSSTASTTVPVSRAGQSSHPLQVAQVTPLGCASLALTQVLTGSGNMYNNSSHVLVLGSAGTDRITSDGKFNCIVGGDGKDRVSAENSDVCIVGPDHRAKYSGCTEKAG